MTDNRALWELVEKYRKFWQSNARDMAEELAAILERPVVVGGWLPIESAPKDGTRVLLTIQWDDDPVIASFIQGGWYADTSFISVRGDASLDTSIKDQNLIGWAPIPGPKWRSDETNESMVRGKS